MKQCQSLNRGENQWVKKIHTPSFLVLFILSFTLGLTACSSPPRLQQKPPEKQSANQSSQSNLTFSDVTLEQADEVGRPVWKVTAKKANYTKEKQLGDVENPYGELYQDGQVVYQVQAQQAGIEQDGERLVLKGKIIATDPQNGIVLRGNELEWRPQEDLLIVRNQLHGTHKQLQAVAQEARVKTRTQRMDLSGGVIANSTEPQLQMRTEHLIWQIKDEKLLTSRPVEIDHYKNNQISNRGRGDSAEINLKTQIVNVQKNARVNLIDPPMHITSDSMTWNLNAETIETNSPIQVIHRNQNLSVAANRGRMDIPQKIVYLTGNVYGVGRRRQSLKSQSLTWYVNEDLIAAQGDVVYRQADPPLTFTGQKASGNLQAETITVNGGDSNSRVLTEIIPQEREATRN